MGNTKINLFPTESEVFITDGGLETSLIYDHHIEIPHFAAFNVLYQPQNLSSVYSYYRTFLDMAVQYGTGYLLDTVTWRANPDWIYKMGYDRSSLLSINMEAVKVAQRIKSGYGDRIPILISGCVGPRGDGYQVDRRMSPELSSSYHFDQIYALKQGGVDLITAMTMNYMEEAMGIVNVARMVGIPTVISFTVETDGRLPDGTILGDAILQIDARSDGYPSFYMINCAHPTHFIPLFKSKKPWHSRIGGIRVNASCKSHAELDGSQTLDRGNSIELASHFPTLKKLLPSLRIIGGCCGTDISHVEAIINQFLKQSI